MLSNIGGQSSQTTSLDVLNAKSSASATDGRVQDEMEAKKQTGKDVITLSDQARELSHDHMGAAEAKAAAKDARGEVLQKFTAELSESRSDAAEVIFGVMQKNLESALESAKRQSQQFKEETARLAGLAEKSKSEFPSEDPEMASIYEEGGASGAENIQERTGGESITTKYTAAATGKTTSQSSTNFSRKV